MYWAKISQYYDGCMLKIEFKRAIFHKNVQRSGKGLQMMAYNVSSSGSYRICVTSCHVRMLNGKASTSSCTYKLSAMCSEFWLLFRAREGHKVL